MSFRIYTDSDNVVFSNPSYITKNAAVAKAHELKHVLEAGQSFHIKNSIGQVVAKVTK